MKELARIDWRFVAVSVAISSLGAYCLARGTAPPAVVAAGDASAPRDGGAASAAPASASASASAGAAGADDARGDDLWARARSGEPDDLARLAQAEGTEGLVAGATDKERRTIAIRALAHADGLGALPFLAEVSVSGAEGEPEAALESIAALAARPRRSRDPDEALELRAGCDALLGLAKDAKAPRTRRVRAVSALRMLAERGCVDRRSIPTDLDAK